MPRMKIQKGMATHHGEAWLSPVSEMVVDPVAAEVFEFFSQSVDTQKFDFMSQMKVEMSMHDSTYLMRYLSASPEHLHPVADPNDWPAPAYVCEVDGGSWVSITKLGAVDLSNCDMGVGDTHAHVYDALGMIPGMDNPAGGWRIKIENEVMYARGSSALLISFIVRGYDNTSADVHEGHDMGAQDPGPPPIPPDTVHDSVYVWVPPNAFVDFFACSQTLGAVMSHPVPYIAPGAHYGQFLPIMLRYLVEYLIKKTIKKTTILKPPSPVKTGSILF